MEMRIMDENNSICVSTQFDSYGEDDFRKVTIELVLNDEASKAVHMWVADGCKGELCITREGCTYVALGEEISGTKIEKKVKELEKFKELVEKEHAPLIVMTQEVYDEREAELKKLREKCTIGPDRKIHYPDGSDEPYFPDTVTTIKTTWPNTYTHITCSDSTCPDDQVKK